MSRKSEELTYVYPELGSKSDLWFVRLSGHGLGNSFYNYFHSVALAEQFKARVIVPPWFSLKLGPILRGESSKRLYLGMFKPYPGEIYGVRKLWALLKHYRKRVTVEIDGSRSVNVVRGKLNLVTCNNKFSFEGLYAHREIIRHRMIAIVKDPIPPNHSWGGGGYIAVHVRMGEFIQVSDPHVIAGSKSNIRIPLTWYVNVVRALRVRYAERPIYVFSDGQEEELKPILELGATSYRSGSDLTDLLAMSGASTFVASNSTYSRWAVFLGNMPSIWLKREFQDEKPSSPETPILYVPIDTAEPTLWADGI